MLSSKKYWDSIGSKYANGWEENKARRYFSERELAFVASYLQDYRPKNILDIGVGTGRIFNKLLKESDKNTLLSGIDISGEMIKICRKDFRDNRKIKYLRQFDVSKESIESLGKFNLITAIRVLKYNKNWQEILKKIQRILLSGGILIFTMPNKYSVNSFLKSSIPIYRTTKGELKGIINKTGYEILKMESFSKIPDFFYSCPLGNNFLYIKLLNLLEGVLRSLLGSVTFGRTIFVAVKKLDE